MARIVVSLLAQADTAAIVADLAANAGRRVAAEYVKSFEALYARLAIHPDSGAPRPAIGSHVRIGIVTPYIAIYEFDSVVGAVTIFRIVHGRRRITGAILGGA